jgi:predicted dehydrogenase
MQATMLERFGRTLRLGIVGGGLDSVIGQTHLYALRLDGMIEVAAGAMSIVPEIARASARALLLPSERAYDTWREMVDGEAARADGIDAVCVLTPPQTHAEISVAFLEAGIDVICEKPMTATLEQARTLEQALARSGRLFLLTHCYTGYPMVREARELIATGAIGTVRMVEGEFAGGDPGVLREPEDLGLRHWRFQPGSMGKASVLGEVGSHIHNLVEYVTGRKVTTVSARLATVAERREVYDDAYLDVEFDGGATGRLWSSFVAAGQDHGLRFRIFGDAGSLRWAQEDPEYLWLQPAGEPARRIARGYECASESSRRATRIRPGHPEGYLAAFANLYHDFARAVISQRLGEPDDVYMDELPGIQDGVRTLALLEAAVRSNDRAGAREAVAA